MPSTGGTCVYIIIYNVPAASLQEKPTIRVFSRNQFPPPARRLSHAGHMQVACRSQAGHRQVTGRSQAGHRQVMENNRSNDARALL